MPTNIEIKAHARQPEAQRKLAESLADGPATSFAQRDTFFSSARGRLKLREETDRSELIFYNRPDSIEPSSSDYAIVEVTNAPSMRDLLGHALGVRGEVRKIRTLWMVGQTRVHFDEVDGLGSFIELEVVLRPEQSQAEGQRIAEKLMAKLQIDRADLLEVAYIDLLV